jgi:hypothetical protein
MAQPSTPFAVSSADHWARALPAIEVALILAVFFVHAGWPAPDINEAHYLGKAKHYWDPSWRHNDFFLNTADAHQVFYWTFGWLTRWLPLAGVAWVGRVACWSLMACGWRRLSEAFAPGPFYCVLSAAVMVALNDRFQLSGEWIVGGLEAKEVAFALVFFALADMVRGRWTRMWLLFGAASAFHVLVGGWSAIAAGVVWLSAGKERPPLGSTLLAWAGAAVLALPGLAPALALTWRADAATVAEASRIYVFERLDHHLVFSSFPPEAVKQFAMLVALWALLAWLTPRGPAERRMWWFVGASLGVAAGGIAITYGLRGHERLAAALLRYYWFRCADAMVPVGAALAAVAYLQASLRARPGWGAIWLLALLLGAGAHLVDVLQFRLTYPSPRADWTVEDPEAWWEICDWARDNTPSDAVFMVPRMAATFGWRTDRAEVVNRKDIPQDAPGLVAWRQRIRDLYWREADKDGPADWRGSLAALGRDRLIELGAKYGADYVLTSAYPPVSLMRVSPPNAVYAVYKLPSRTANPAGKTPPPR